MMAYGIKATLVTTWVDPESTEPPVEQEYTLAHLPLTAKDLRGLMNPIDEKQLELNFNYSIVNVNKE